MLKHSRFALGRSLLLLLVVLLAACAPAATEADTPDGSQEPSQLEQLPVPIEELLVYVPAGRFVMGSDPEFDTLAEDDEFPQHSVLLDGFFIYRNEVTNGLYKQCVAAGDCTEPTIFEEGPSTYYNDPEYLNHPIVGVTWAQADAFCTWADSRLPTEAEWEKTARGEFGNIYPWGNNDPECSLANLDGCFMDPEFTDKIGQRPDGESLYEADDMAGNVWEWTQDWYDEDYYHTAPGMNPAGPENGELRVVRGGSYEDNLEALRSAERLALDPEEAYNNVGFRCVPIGLPSAAQAPFCQTTYTPFCFGDEPDCGPLAQATPQSDDYEFVTFGCPQDGLITMRIVANRPAGNGETVMVGAAVYTCIDSTVYPGQWICTGSPPPAGTLTTVQVCPGPTAAGGGALVAFGGQPVSPSGEQLVAYQPAAAAQPAGLQAFEPQSGPQGLAAFQTAAGPDYCPDGYVYNPTTGQCEQTPDGVGCPEGWSYSAAAYACVPGDGACPAGTVYNSDSQACEPETGQDCPAGFDYAEASNSCQPGGGDVGGCPAGYYFDTQINCCAPLTGDNLGCESGFYRSVATNECLPLDQNGCQQGYIYNRYEGGCVPDYGNTQFASNDCRLPGYVMNEAGQCEPAGTVPTADCDQGAYYDPYSQQCEPLGENGCQPGYRYDPLTEACLPGDGPGSGCPAGYVFSERLNCCAAGPGTDGSACLGDEQPVGRLISYVAAPSLTGFDYGLGYCDPEGSRITGQIECPAGTAYDEGLGYCLQTQCGCALGTYYDARSQTCLPYGETQSGCWTYTVSVPVCPYVTPTPSVTQTCDRGETFNPRSQRCEDDSDGGGDGSGTSPTVDPRIAYCAGQSGTFCTAAGCTWTGNACVP